jgi:two-component system response regulator ResD
MARSTKRVLVVDDEPGICEGVENILTRAGYEVEKAFSGEEALAMSEREAFDLILMDLIMPGMDGVDACDRIRRTRPDARVVAITGSPVGSRVERFRNLAGIGIFLFKPFGKEELLASVEKALGTE